MRTGLADFDHVARAPSLNAVPCLSVCSGQSKLEKEKEELGDFVPLPFHFMEIGKMLVDVNTDYLKVCAEQEWKAPYPKGLRGHGTGCRRAREA